MADERLQKILSAHGVASRRHAEEMLLAGRIRVNDRVVTELGTRADPGRDRIEVDGEPLRHVGERVYVALNKPVGYITTARDPHGRRTVMDLLAGLTERVFPVGRLDHDSSGLLLLTNDGDFAYALTHPSREVPKTYLCRVRGVPSAESLRALARGVELEDGVTAPARVRLIGSAETGASIQLTIHEGRNRQVRRMLAAVGHPVEDLTRTRIGHLGLAGLAPGQWRLLRPEEVAEFTRAAAGANPRSPKRKADRKQSP
jgi:pseudouridine synthase